MDLYSHFFELQKLRESEKIEKKRKETADFGAVGLENEQG